jgi:hypothetical protein
MAQTFIYAIYCPNKQQVKIGYATNPFSRLSSLQVATTDRLDLLFCFVGGISEEKMLHQHFKDYKLTGEWFEYNSYIATELLKFAQESLPFTSKLVEDKYVFDKLSEACIINTASTFSKQFTISEIKHQSPDLSATTKQIEKILLFHGYNYKQYGTSRKKYFYLNTGTN